MSRRQRVHCVRKKPRSFLLFFLLFFRRYLVNVSTVRLIMSHHLTLFFIVVENKSSEYLQNLVNFWNQNCTFKFTMKMSTCIKNTSLAFFLDRNKDNVMTSLLFYFFFLNHDSFPVVHPTTILRTNPRSAYDDSHWKRWRRQHERAGAGWTTVCHR